MEKLENIVFDKEDQELFLIDDLQLKAQAIRNSILPKMQVVMNYAINQIDKVYDVNVFDDCMIAQAPHYRLHQRVYDIKKDYQYARISIRGQRKFGKWNGIKKANGEEPQLTSFTLELHLVNNGLFILLSHDRKFLSKNSYKKVFDFLTKYDSAVNTIQKTARVFDNRGHAKSDWLTNNKDWLEAKFKGGDFDTSIFSDPVPYPIGYDQLNLVIDRLTLLYPIFHSYMQIAKGQKVEFNKLVMKANDWWFQKRDDFVIEQEDNKELDLHFIKIKAETKIKVMPGLRWQVFQRDNWRCVSCGRGAHDGIILHVDHITPRSKGGRDEIKNYQTLCDICNIGKSNKDKTDLRAS
jgi:HNH endonuclease